MNYAGAVFHNPRLFKKSEEKRRPVSMVSVYSNVACCVDLIAKAICNSSPFRGFDSEKRLQYAVQILMDQQERLRKRLTQKAKRAYPARIPLFQRIQSILH